MTTYPTLWGLRWSNCDSSGGGLGGLGLAMASWLVTQAAMPFGGLLIGRDTKKTIRMVEKHHSGGFWSILIILDNDRNIFLCNFL